MAHGLPLLIADGRRGGNADATSLDSTQQPYRAADRSSEGAAGTMATTMKTMSAAQRRRDHALKKMLEDRRRQLVYEVQAKIRDGRRDYTKEHEVLDEGESSEVDVQEEIEFSLIQMKAETLKKIDAALRRIGEGSYGVCFECGEKIAEARLRALPFAVRCRDCEEAREAAEWRERMMQRRVSSTPFVDMVN
jgi:DnaK suppressor protein